MRLRRIRFFTNRWSLQIISIFCFHSKALENEELDDISECKKNTSSRLYYPMMIGQTWMRPYEKETSQYLTTGGKLLTPEQGCGKTDKILNPRIVGGINAKPGKFKWNICYCLNQTRIIKHDSQNEIKVHSPG